MAQDERIRTVADEMEIRNLIARIAMETDLGPDLETYGSLFTEDAHWRLRGTAGSEDLIVDGRSAIVAAGERRRADGLTGPGSHKYHMIVSTALETLTSDRAKAKSYLMYLTQADTKPEVAMMTIYNDEFRRTADGWRLAARIIDRA